MKKCENKINGVLQCEAQLCCKATAELKLQVQQDINNPDRPIAEVLEGQTDEDKDLERQ